MSFDRRYEADRVCLAIFSTLITLMVIFSLSGLVYYYGLEKTITYTFWTIIIGAGLIILALNLYLFWKFVFGLGVEKR